MDEVKDLSNIYGFARLYATLTDDGRISGDNAVKMMYNWYLANISAYNDFYGADIQPLEPEIFAYKLKTAHVQPYKTDIQTIKALTLLEWNVADMEEFANSNNTLFGVKRDYAQMFYEDTGYSYRDPETSYHLCEDTLDPEHEPEQNMDTAAVMRKYDTGPKLVYICAPLRGDVEKNIEFARQKAKNVFAEGNIPICPHLLFPPIADVANPSEDKAAMAMCLKLIDRCNEIRVYGDEWSEGMWSEIRYAVKMKIPMKMEQKEITNVRRHKAVCR